MAKRALLLVGVLCFVACGDAKNRLFGSISEIYNLEFDVVRLSRVGDFLVIEYVRETGEAAMLGKPAKLTVNLAGLTVVPGQGIDLTEMASGGPRGTLQRILQTIVELPIERGSLTLDQLPTAGTEISGRFRVTTSNPMGRTLNGDFSGGVAAP